MEFDDFEGIEQVSAGPEEILAGLKNWFHEIMLENDAIVGVVSARLDEEKDEKSYLEGTILLEPIFNVDNEDSEHYGISLTRQTGNGKWVMSQADPLPLGMVQAGTDKFVVDETFVELLEKSGYNSEENIKAILTLWQKAVKVFYEVMPEDIAPDPTCYNTFRLKDENQSLDLLDQTSDEEFS